jgi:transcriptional regulator GlxA family with amidase domain
MPRDLAIVIYPGFQLLDAAGPIAAFDIANRYFSNGAYRVATLAPEAGLVSSMASVQLLAEGVCARSWDTIIVAGGDYETSAAETKALEGWVASTASRARRVVSRAGESFRLSEKMYGSAARTRCGRG